MILKGATNKFSNTKHLLFSSDARTAWGHLIENIGKATEGELKVLLPSYIGFTEREGSGVFDPIEQTNSRFDFYKVGENLEVNMEHFETQLKKGDFKVVLIIHYFGFCRNNIKLIKQLCEKYNVLLVEDCAHAFHLELEKPQLGNKGDYSFYSLHKYMATDSGGVLQVNNETIQIDELPAAKKAGLEVLEQYIKTDFQEIAKIRRANYSKYFSMLQNHTEMDIMYQLEEDEVPQSFPLRIKNNKREKLYFYLMEREIPTTALYYRLIKEIPKEKFPLSYTISNEILNLPVHQDTTIEDVEVICAAISDFWQQG